MPRRVLFSVLFSLVSLILDSRLASVQMRPATLSGEVADRTGAVIAQATVSARRGSSGLERSVSTSADGAFSIAELPAGEYEVRAASPGFAVSVRRVTLVPAETLRVDFMLDVGGLTEDVVVFAPEVVGSHERLRRLPGSVEIVERETLDRSHVFTTNEALRKVSGVHVRDEEGFGLRPNIGMRGLNPTRSNKVLLLEDGIPLTYAPYGDNASYYHPPVERFQRIEVLKGGAQIAYGPQTIAGLVNYITPTPPARPMGAVTLSGGNRGYFNGHASYGATVGQTGLLFDYMRKQGDGAREATSSQLNDVNAKLTRAAGNRQLWTWRGNYYSEDSNITYSGLRQDEFLAHPRGNPFRNDFLYIDRFGTSATHAYTPSGDVALTTNLYFTSFRRHWWRQSSNSSQRPNDAGDPKCAGMANLNTTCGNEGRLRQYYTWGIEPRVHMAHRMFGVANELDVGARVHFERQDRRQENGDAPTARSGVLAENNLRDNQAYSSFVQNRFLLGGWTVTPGMRLEHVAFTRTNRCGLTPCALATPATPSVSGTTSLTQVVPGIGVSYTWRDRLTLFGGAHRGFAPPRTEDVITNQGGFVDLDPELSWNYEAGVRATPMAGLGFDAALFRMDYENQIVPASLAGGIGATLTNGGATRHQGLELASRLDTAAVVNSMHNAFVRVAYTYVPVAEFAGTRFSNIPGFSTVSVSGNRLPYAPEHLLTVGFGYTHPSGFDAMLEAVRTTDQFGDDLNTVTPTPDGQRGLLPGYTVWNVAVNQPFGRMTVFVTVKNLLDELFIVDRARGILPGSPRLVQAGLRVRF